MALFFMFRAFNRERERASFLERLAYLRFLKLTKTLFRHGCLSSRSFLVFFARLFTCSLDFGFFNYFYLAFVFFS